MSTVVVGAGLAGIASAILASRGGADVTLVDAEARIGGLLRSEQRGGAWFDLGTHVPREIGVPALDSLLFEGLEDEPGWRSFQGARAGHVLAGRLNEATEFPDLHALGPGLHDQALRELLERQPVESTPSDDASDVTRRFGPTVRDHVLGPAVEKFLGTPLDALQPGAHRLFTSRVVAGDPAAVQRLKADPWVDDRLAYHDSSVAASRLRSFYPTEGGVERWVRHLCERHLATVRVITGHAVVGVQTRSMRTVGVTLDDGRAIPADRVVWTVGLFPFLRAAGAPPPALAPPPLRRTWLTHLLVDRPLRCSAHYITCYDTSTPAFRVTLYPNLRDAEGAPPYNLTVETLVGRASDRPAPPESIASSLMEWGALQPGTRLLGAWEDLVPLSFPVPTLSLATLNAALRESASDYEGVVFVGRGAGRAFFMADVLSELPERLSPLIG